MGRPNSEAARKAAIAFYQEKLAAGQIKKPNIVGVAEEDSSPSEDSARGGSA